MTEPKPFSVRKGGRDRKGRHPVDPTSGSKPPHIERDMWYVIAIQARHPMKGLARTTIPFKAGQYAEAIQTVILKRTHDLLSFLEGFIRATNEIQHEQRHGGWQSYINLEEAP